MGSGEGGRRFEFPFCGGFFACCGWMFIVGDCENKLGGNGGNADSSDGFAFLGDEMDGRGFVDSFGDGERDVVEGDGDLDGNNKPGGKGGNAATTD